MNKLLNLLRGIDDAAPAAVGFARGLAEAAVIGGLVAAALTFANTDFHAFGLNDTGSTLVLMGGAWAFRQAEALADHIDPKTKRGQ